MLDELLGRAELKDRIDELITERDRLEERLAAEERRRKEAVRDRQAAEQRVNQLEDRIAGLEGELDRRTDEKAELDFARVERMSHQRTGEIIRRLESVRTAEDGAYTAVLDAETAPSADLDSILGDRRALLMRARPCIACLDDAGLIRVALSPPRFPDSAESWGDRFDLDREWFVPVGRFTFALVRADTFALGTYEGRDRVDFEGFRSKVQSRHSKGGFSQARFERRRDEQIEAHLDRCREALNTRASGDLILVGDRRMIKKLSVDAAATDVVDATGKPKEALTDAFDEFWRTQLYVL